MADVITRLKLESGEYDSKIKRAVSALQQMEAECRKVGGTLAVLEKDQMDYVRNIGKMETVSRSARGKIAELTSAFVEFSAQYKRLSAEEKNGDIGKALSASLAELKVRITDAKGELKDITDELNSTGESGKGLASVLQQLGGQFGISGDLMGVVTTGAIGYTAAITAAATATIAATKAWVDYNTELSKQTQITTVTTGLKGADADSMTDFAAAVSKIYNVDFRDTINAANTLMNQFGKSSNEAMQLIRDGMQGMISGDGPKMLNMIQQFAPAFRDAGISADQLIAVIHNSEGGLFSDQNMNAILMGIKNIRLMTNSTSEALAQLGIDGEEMTKKMNDGSMTVFEALRKVSEAIEGANASSKEAGEVMQQVFGRQGAMQGMKLGRAIATLNLNLEETKKHTGAVGASMADLESETERLNESIRRAVGYQGWDMMATRIKSEVVGAIASVIGTAESLRETINDITGIDVFSTLISSALDAIGPVGMLLDKLRQIAGLGQVGSGESGQGSGQRPQMQNPLRGVVDKFNQKSTIDQKPVEDALSNIRKDADLAGKSIAELNSELKRLKDARDKASSAGNTSLRDEYNQQIRKVQEQIKALRGGPTTPKTTTPKTEEQQIQAQIQSLQQEYIKATEPRRAEIRVEVKGLQERQQEIQRLKDEAAGKVVVPIEYPEGSLQSMEAELKRLKDAQGKALDNYEWVAYQQAIEEATKKIGILKGELPKGMQATYTLEVNKEQLDALSRDGLFAEKDVRVNVELAGDPLDTVESLDDREYTLTIAADTVAAVDKVGELVKDIEHQQPVIEPKVEMPQNLETQKQSIEAALNINDAKVDTTTFTTLLRTAVKNGISDLDGDFSELFAKMGSGLNIPDDTWQMLQDEINTRLQELGIDPIKIDFETGNVKNVEKDAKGIDKSFNAAASAVQNVGNALSNLEDPGAKVAGIIAEAVANIALGFATATSKSAGGGVFGWIAAIAGGLATMTSTIAAIHNVTGYATGGVVEGPSGVDKVPAMLTAGEVVLNHAQQNALASELEGGGIQNLSLETRISAEDIRLVLNNRGRRTGKGEYIQSNFR